MLEGGAILRWDSYVNIRNVYKINWALLKPYVNHNTPETALFRLEWESTARMIAKGKILTLYEPSEQVPISIPQPIRARTAPLCLSTEPTSTTERGIHELSSPDLDTETVAILESSATPRPPVSSFRSLSGDGNRSVNLPPGEPPAKTNKSFLGQLRDRLCICGIKSLDVD